MDSDHLDDSLEDGCLQVGASGETNADDGTAWADVLGGLLEGLLVDGNEDDNVGTKTIGCCLLDVGDKVLARGEVDKGLGTKFSGAHLLLLIAGVDSDCSYTHSLCVLASKRTETTTSTDDGGELTGLDTRLLQALVDGDTGTQNWSNGSEITFLGNAGDVSSLGDAVLLEGTVDSVSR